MHVDKRLPAFRRLMPLNDANRLGLRYRELAGHLPYKGPIIDVHTHIHSAAMAERMLDVADLFRIRTIFSMSPLEQLDAIRAVAGDRIKFIAVPNYLSPNRDDAFSKDWLHRIEQFRNKGVTICKFWAAPRGRDISKHLHLDSPARLEAMKLAHSLGYTAFMTHVGDPDTWFATHYRDARRYGLKESQFVPLRRMLDRYPDMPWIGAHLGGWPERPDFLQKMLHEHPNYHLDTSATKWMVRECSRRRDEIASFLRRNTGRILFGSDTVADDATYSFDLLASRYWALRMLFETRHEGPSPIVDPDLRLVDPAHPPLSTALLQGVGLRPHEQHTIYHRAAERFMKSAKLL